MKTPWKSLTINHHPQTRPSFPLPRPHPRKENKKTNWMIGNQLILKQTPDLTCKLEPVAVASAVDCSPLLHL